MECVIDFLIPGEDGLNLIVKHEGSGRKVFSMLKELCGPDSTYEMGIERFARAVNKVTSKRHLKTAVVIWNTVFSQEDVGIVCSILDEGAVRG
jgi:hypothetical protein